MDKNHIFVGFGFGPIQAGLFACEAFKSGNFSRIVIAEIDQELVSALRASRGQYTINIASHDGIVTESVSNIETYHPGDPSDRKALLQALSQATEIVTSLPSVQYYSAGEHSVVSLIKQGLESSQAPATIIYAAENHNHAAEMLQEQIGSCPRVQYLNTVIGKMSQVIADPHEIARKQLIPITPGLERAYLVESFNQILVSRCHLSDFKPGIPVFIEKDDLLPFEEAKLYGHNAIHALLAYLGADKGYTKMSQLIDDQELMQIAREAFIGESGRALVQKYADLNEELFTESGYRAYAEDLLARMTNPYLDDSIERAARDPQRKLAPNDRIFGTINLARSYGIDPVNMAKAADAGLAYLHKHPSE